MRCTRFLAFFVVMVSQAQVAEDVRRATLGNTAGTSGKCTVGVYVDMIAEVNIFGDSGLLRTLAGQPASWTHLECTSPLPYQMTDFKFRGVEGRGTQRLVADPRTNDSIAVVRIEDPRSGAANYTFEIEWSGGSGGYAVSGFLRSGAARPEPIRPARRAGLRPISAERALDLCRAEVHARGERDYGLLDIDITAVGVDTSAGRSNWVTGTFTARARSAPEAAYRFNCAMDYAAGQVGVVEFLRPDGSRLQPPGATAVSTEDQARLFRACQDAAVARVNQLGYQNVQFNSTEIDPRRSGWMTGSLTARRVLVTDTFDFGCSMDFRTGRLIDVQVTRR